MDSWAEVGTELMQLIRFLAFLSSGLAVGLIAVTVMFALVIVGLYLLYSLMENIDGWLSKDAKCDPVQLVPPTFGEDLDDEDEEEEEPNPKLVCYSPVEANDRRTVYAGTYGSAVFLQDLIDMLPQEKPGGRRYMKEHGGGKFVWVVEHPPKKAGES